MTPNCSKSMPNETKSGLWIHGEHGLVRLGIALAPPVQCVLGGPWVHVCDGQAFARQTR
jgi:hypothetical protein